MEHRRALVLGAAAVLLVMAVAAPYLVYPRVVRSLASPDGRYVAEVVVSPTRGFLPHLTLLTGQSIDVIARVRRLGDSKIVFEQVLTEMEDQESDAAEAEIVWESPAKVRFLDCRDQAASWSEP